MIKSMSDASGQPIDRLHLREQDTLRTLALIERTTIRRRQGEMLKVYHADVRAAGRDNAEISLALMERAHMAAVIVGPMQPQAIDAMLTALHDAASQPDWRCPTLLFLLPPAAVWIANKIAGIAWQRALEVRIRDEPLTDASAAWSAVLGAWNRVKEQRLLDRRKGDVEFAVQLVERRSAAAEDSANDSAGPITIVPAELSTEAQPAPSSSAASIDARRASRALVELLRTNGLLACALVDSASGLVLAGEQRGASVADFDIAAAAAAQALRAQRLAARNAGLVAPIEELIVSAGMRQQVLRVLARQPELFMVEADRAWFMEHGRLTVVRSKAISREVNRLCRRVRPIAVELVDAFGVPAEMLRSPDLVG